MVKVSSFIEVFGMSEITQEKISHINQNDFHISKRTYKGSSSNTLAQSALRFTKYHMQDLRKEFCGVEGGKRYLQFQKNLEFLTQSSDSKTKEKVQSILERVRSPAYDQLSLIDEKISQAAIGAKNKSFFKRAEIVADPLFGINQLFHSAFDQFLYGSALPVREAVVEPETPEQLREIRNIVISGGGAKGAVLPGAFRTLDKKAPKLMRQIESVAGTSVGAISASLLATGISRETLQEIGGVDYEKLLGRSLIQKSGRNLTSFIRQCIRINILQRLSSLSPEKKSEFMKHNSEMAVQIISELKKPSVEKSRITFEMLAYLRIIDPEHFKDLYVTAVSKDGKQIVFSAENTPANDIALACRASASIPFVFKPVQAEVNGEDKVLYDGGVIDNVPVKIFAEKGQTANQTMVIVYEKPIQHGGASLFDQNNPTSPYRPGRISRFVRDRVVPFITGMTLSKPNTVAKFEVLKDVKDHYPHIVSFQVDLNTIAFRQASRNPEKYAKIGKAAIKSFLERRAI